MLEREPFQRLVKSDNLMAFCHEGYWQCVDTKREKELVELSLNEGSAPWLELSRSARLTL